MSIEELLKLTFFQEKSSIFPKIVVDFHQTLVIHHPFVWFLSYTKNLPPTYFLHHQIIHHRSMVNSNQWMKLIRCVHPPQNVDLDYNFKASLSSLVRYSKKDPILNPWVCVWSKRKYQKFFFSMTWCHFPPFFSFFFLFFIWMT